MIIEFTVSINIDPEDSDELSDEQFKLMDKLGNDFEEVVGKNNYELNECVWEEQ